MDIQSLLKLWPQYQTWLKQNNINESNVQEKTKNLINQIKQDPQKASQLNNILSSPELANVAKSLNLSNEQIQKIQNVFNDSSNSTQTGNLTPQQLEMIKKFKR